MLPFSINFSEVVENKEAVLNGLSAIQHFFDGNIWSHLGADDLCDLFAVPAFWPAFEPEKWEEKEHLLYVSGLEGQGSFCFLSFFSSS